MGGENVHSLATFRQPTVSEATGAKNYPILTRFPLCIFKTCLRIILPLGAGKEISTRGSEAFFMSVIFVLNRLCMHTSERHMFYVKVT